MLDWFGEMNLSISRASSLWNKCYEMDLRIFSNFRRLLGLRDDRRGACLHKRFVW